MKVRRNEMKVRRNLPIVPWRTLISSVETAVSYGRNQSFIIMEKVDHPEEVTDKVGITLILVLLFS